MLAEQNDIMIKATEFVHKVSDEEYLKMLYEAREDQLRQQRDAQYYFQNEINDRDAYIEKLKNQIKEMGETPVDK